MALWKRCHIAGIIVMTSAMFISAQDTSVTLYGSYGWSSNFRSNAARLASAGFRWNRCMARGSQEADVTAAARNKINIAMGLVGSNTYEKDSTGWRDYVRTQVKRFGPKGTFWSENPNLPYHPVRYWEIWNEPNLDEFLQPPAGQKRDECYFNLLKAAYVEIKAIDSTLKVVAFNTAGGAWQSGISPMYISSDGLNWGFLAFIKAVNARAGGNYYDICGVHPYTIKGTSPNKIVYPPDEGGIVKALDSIRADMARYGKVKPIWYTEVGYPLVYPKTKPITEEEQAQHQVKLHALAGAHGVEHIEIMYVTDIIYGPDGSSRQFGLFRDNGTARPQTKALEFMISQVTSPVRHYKGSFAIGDRRHAYRFSNKTVNELVCCWAEQDSADVKIPAAGTSVELLDMYGVKISNLTISGGCVTMPVSQKARYVRVYNSQTGVHEMPSAPGSNRFAMAVHLRPVHGGGVAFTWDGKIWQPDELLIYNPAGTIVYSQIVFAGSQSAVWDGRTFSNRQAGTGIYVCGIKTKTGSNHRHFMMPY